MTPDLAAAVDAIGDLVLLRDAEGRVVWVNGAFRRTFGGALADWQGRWFALGQDAGGGSSPGGRRRFDSFIETVAGPAAIEWEETSLADGGATLVGRDVSARRAGEEVLKGARADAEAAARAKDRLFAMVTHEFRTPIAGVLGLADLLANTPLTPEQRAYVDALSASGRHLLDLVNDILDAAKLEEGGFAVAPETVDPSELLQGVGELLAPRARVRGLELAVVLDPDLPRAVRLDPARVRQVLLNLAGNAVKFTDRGGVTLTLSAATGSAEGSVRLDFAVRDTGPGIPAAHRERIFEAFEQVDAGSARRVEGAGLGLAIATRLAAAMNAKIDLVTREGEGSVFTLALEVPRLDAQDATGFVAARPLAGCAIAVAAGNDALAAALIDQIRRLGGDARAILADQSLAPDEVLFADIGSAEAFAAHAKGAARAIVLAAPDERQRLAAHLAAGYGGWLVKPWRLSALIAQARSTHAAPAPAVADVVEPPPPAATTAARNPAAAPRFAGLRVLLVEDNPVNRLLAETHLKRLGCVVSWVGAGPAAVEATATERFDLIFLDMRLPGLDGPEVARRIRARGGVNAQAPIVAFTANTTDADRAACLAAGMNDFLVKPAGAEAFAQALDRWTARARVATVAS